MALAWSVSLIVLMSALVAAQTNEALRSPILGNVESNYRAFLGIRYTGAPIGQYRFAAPPPLAPWTDPLPVQSFAPGCPQVCELPPHTCPPVTSEDCLFLNVFTPRLSAMKGLVPVMVYLAGGRFEQGTGGCDLYSGQYITPNSNIVLVTINYRLGALGFFYSSGTKEGNFAISDQRLALQWVQANIRNFGGDPTRVTLSGQSAGAISTITHLISPASVGLFHQAAVMSDPFTLGFKTTDDASAQSKKFASDLGCSYTDLGCLRNATIPSILAAQKQAQSKINLLHILGGFMPWLPTVDGTSIPYDAFTAIAQGKFTKMPIFLGTVWEEARLFIYQAWNNTLSDLDYVGILTAVFNVKMLDVLKMYPDDHAPDTRDVLSVLGTDYIFHCPTRWFVRTIAAQQPGIPVYTYMFNHSWSFDGWGPNFPDCVGHVCHGAELPFVFDAAQPFYNFTAPEQALSYELADYWGNFVNSALPNTPLAVAPIWTVYNRSADLTIDFLTGLSKPATTLVEGMQSDTCDFWDSLGYQY